ncbi:MAG: hypothetical protein WCF70_08625 [Dehalococcoidales bacterium]|jgi:hypothetical protein
MKKKKKNRGGQKGNQNARKHGFYSSFLIPDEINQFCKIVNTENVNLDVAVLRIKVQGVLQQAPDNRRVLYDASRLIARKYGAQLHFDRSDCASLKSVVNAGLQLAAGTLPDPLKLTGKLL